MCNRLYEKSEKIKKEGFGYKIFSLDNKNCFDETAYSKQKNNWVKWGHSFYEQTQMNKQKELIHFIGKENGFCFFLTKKEAMKCLNRLQNIYLHKFNKHKIKKIQYKEGMGKHIEYQIDGDTPFEIGLCKQFKIMSRNKK